MVASLPLCMEAPVNSSSSLDLHGAVQYLHYTIVTAILLVHPQAPQLHLDSRASVFVHI